MKETYISRVKRALLDVPGANPKKLMEHEACKGMKAHQVKNALDQVRYRKTKKKWVESNQDRILLKGAKHRANRLGLEFDITADDIKIPERCPMLDIKLQKYDKPGGHSASPTVDRIDSSKGYIKGNVRVISMRANRMKSDANIENVKALLEYLERGRE